MSQGAKAWRGSPSHPYRSRRRGRARPAHACAAAGTRLLLLLLEGHPDGLGRLVVLGHRLGVLALRVERVGLLHGLPGVVGRTVQAVVDLTLHLRLQHWALTSQGRRAADS